MPFTDACIATLLDVHGLGRLQHWQQLEHTGSNPACIVNGNMVLRLDVCEPERAKFRKEAALFQRLHAETALPVPEVLALDVSRSVFPYDALLVERLPGVNALMSWPYLDGPGQWQVSYDMGQALSQLHGLTCPGYGGVDPQTGELGYMSDWQLYLLDKTAEILVDLWECAAFPDVVLEDVERYMLRAFLPPAPPPVVVHGDYGLHNVLVMRRGTHWRLSGLVDFEWAIAADAEYEFATGLLVEPDEVNPLPAPFLVGYRTGRSLAEGWEQRSRVYRLIYHLNLCRVVCRNYGGNPSKMRYHYDTIVDVLKAGW